MAIGFGQPRPGQAPPDPYANMPTPQPIDNTWYLNALRAQEQLARRQAQQQAMFARQQAGQYANFANQYQQMNQDRMAQAQGPVRQSRFFHLGGY